MMATLSCFAPFDGIETRGRRKRSAGVVRLEGKRMSVMVEASSA
jgi:hypothetical protein